MRSSSSCASSSSDTADARSRFRVPGSMFQVPGSVFRVPGSVFRVPGSVFRVPGSVFPIRRSLFLAALVAAHATVAHAQRPFALEDMAAFRSIPDVALSPDGRRAVFAVRTTILSENRTQTDLWAVPVDGSAPARQLTFDRAAESGLRWSPDGTRIAFLADRDGTRQVWALPVGGGEAARLTSHPQPIAAFDFSPDGSQVAFLAAPDTSDDEKRREREKDDGYLLGAQWRNHRVWIGARQLTDGRLHVRSLAWSPDGGRIAVTVAPTAEADASQDARAQVIDVASGQAEDVPGGALAGNLAWSPGGGLLAFTRPFDGRAISRDDVHVWQVGSREAARNISAAVDRDAEELLWTPDGRAVDVKIAHGVTHSIARVQVGGGPPQVLHRFTHSIGVLAGGGGARVFTRTDKPAELYAWVPDGPPRPLTSLNASASQVQRPSAEAVRWKGPIGEVEGVLFTPFGYDAARRYPLVVNPHGGPRGHSTLDFDSAAAYWTSLGYLVLKPNFRGSTGYGDAFTRANVEDWGDGPYRDVMAGVDALVARGVADADRLFMYGWSYGGILANWTATHTDRFKAIVSGASVADGRLQYAISDSRRWRFDYFRGSPFLDAHYPLYQRESPVTHAKHAKTPTLFVVGAEDRRCPPEQSFMMYRAFKDHGVTTELLIYPREDHGFVEPRHILDRAKRAAEWFKRFDTKAPRPATTSSSSR
jgi:dipeptidyl aminopeptidase/acylaminoacyl peptidase